MKRTIIFAALLGVALTAQASILTFEGTGTNVEIPSDWGSDIAAEGTGFNVSNGITPNVALTWSAESGSSGTQWWDFYNDGEWTGTAQLNDFQEGTSYYLTLTPDAGYGVLFDSFVFDDYVGWQGGNDFTWNLYEDAVGGTVIGSGSETTTDGQNLLVNTGMASSYAGTVVFEIFNNEATGEGSDQSIDSISFTQEAIPEPAAFGLLVFGAAGVLFVRRFGLIG